jgi:hypothetical protein
MSSLHIINIEKSIKDLLSERYRTFIVHDRPLTGKSRFAKQLAKRAEGKYLDLLKRFKKDEELKKNIDTFGINELENLLTEESKGENLLILDNVEFLLNTWDDDEYDSFFHLITKNWDSFKKSYSAVLGVFLITNRKINDLKLYTSKKETRIFHLTRLESFEGESAYE